MGRFYQVGTGWSEASFLLAYATLGRDVPT